MSTVVRHTNRFASLFAPPARLDAADLGSWGDVRPKFRPLPQRRSHGDVHFQRCGGGRRVIRKRVGRD